MYTILLCYLAQFIINRVNYHVSDQKSANDEAESYESGGDVQNPLNGKVKMGTKQNRAKTIIVKRYPLVGNPSRMDQQLEAGLSLLWRYGVCYNEI